MLALARIIPVLHVLVVALCQRTTPGPRAGNKDWRRCERLITSEVKAADRMGGQAPKLLFYGDSITEAWRGTDHCLPCDTAYRTACAGLPALFGELYGKQRAAAVGIAGDQVANLVWRLQHGQLPTRQQPKVAVLLIGTNDLGAATRGKRGRAAARALAAAVPGVADRVGQAVRVMQARMPRTHILVLGLLPRGTGSGEELPLAQNNHAWPSAYTDALRGVNARLRSLVQRNGSRRLHYLDCSNSFIATGQRSINAALMPDALHPSLEGYRVLARCQARLLSRLL